jgi:ATP-dependent helicase/DNAse subunit B
MDRLGLSLLVGPANAGKVALLLERYLAALEHEPVLIVPNRPDVERVERDLLARAGALFGGSIGTFDDVFERIAGGRRTITDAQRSLLIERVIGSASLNGLGASARFAGFAGELGRAFSDLAGGLVAPAQLSGDLQRLYSAYRGELDRLGLTDRETVRMRAVERLSSDFAAWDGAPVFAYGFEDLTGAEWELIRALAGRADVTVSIPYEAGRVAFASLRGTVDDLAGLADGRIEELPARFHEYGAPVLAHLERSLFGDDVTTPPALAGALRLLEGGGARGTLELVADELVTLVRAGTAPERIGVIVPSLERWRAPLETAFASLGVPFAIEGRSRLAQTPFGRALLGLLRFVWLGAARRELYGFLRGPFSGVPRGKVDFLEGRLRGRAINAHDRVEAETLALHGHEFPIVRELREAGTPLDGLRAAAASMLRNAHGVHRPTATDETRSDLRAYEAVVELANELDGWEVAPQQIVEALESATVRGPRVEPERIPVLSLTDARTRDFEIVFVLGLEEGTLPRRGDASPFLDDDSRRALGARLVKPDHVERDRYLFYTACTRASRRLYLVREAATDDGGPREPSPFWDEVVRLFPRDEVARATTRRPLAALTWAVDDAPTERERLRALARTAADDRVAAEALARANGWERRLERALRAFERPTELTHPLVLEQLTGRKTFNVTELERMSDCSSAWFVERLLDPRTIDAQVDPKLRGSVAHTTLHRFYAGLPKEVGVDKPDVEHLEGARVFLRACLTQAVEGVRMELTDVQRQELDQGLWRDLSAFLDAEARSELPLVPRELELQFGFERSKHAGLPLGDELFLSGKIDRVDVEVFGARGIVQDYKAGKSAHSAQTIEQEQRLQIPLYMLVLRDLVGVEPLGGLYRPLAGERKPRGLLRAEAKGELPGFTRTDYVEDDEFWTRLDDAREVARGLAQRIRVGDVRHDPRGGACPSWCDLWPMCRVKRA